MIIRELSNRIHTEEQFPFIANRISQTHWHWLTFHRCSFRVDVTGNEKLCQLSSENQENYITRLKSSLHHEIMSLLLNIFRIFQINCSPISPNISLSWFAFSYFDLWALSAPSHLNRNFKNFNQSAVSHFSLVQRGQWNSRNFAAHS